MSYTFRVVFDGICAYVPELPFFTRPAAGDPWKAQVDPIPSLAVLLPDLRRAGKASPDKPTLNLPKSRDPHFPLLTFRLDDLREGTTRRVDLVCRDISERDEQGLLFLRREQIRFEVDCENGKSFTFSKWLPDTLDKQNNHPKPASGQLRELQSLWWLPALDRIVDVDAVPDATKAKTTVLPSFYGPFPDGLIARVECGGGHLRTHDFNRGTDGSPVVWRFAKPEKPDEEGVWNRAIANSLALEFYDVRNAVRIEIKRLANDVVTRHLVLAPAPGASRPVLEISISNREPELLFEEEGFGRLALPDMDFQAFYEKLSPVDPKKLPDLPVPYPARKAFFGIREKPCAGAVMAG
ncbi:MAG TPA: hypothetical protein VNJ70_04975 [Thermoanaerobaculia bacterium]|nr:hypothetical protein [Thermoanaerobaculia bacterium]